MPEKPIRSSWLTIASGTPFFGQIAASGRLVEQAGDIDDGIVVDGDYDIGVLDIVDPGHVLVADALDAVSAETVLQQGGALQCFAGNDLAAGEELLHIVAAGDGAGRAGGGSHAAIRIAWPHGHLQDFFHGMPGDLVVPQVVAKFLELVEDHQVLTGAAQLPALVEDLFDVRFAAGRGNHFTGDLGEPIEALAAHPLRQDSDRLAAQQSRVIGAAPAEVAGGRPDRFLAGGVELTGDQAGDQAAESRADFVRSGREPFTNQNDDARRYAGQAGRQLQVIDFAKTAALG